MIEKMTRYDFVLLSGLKDEFIERLASLGVMDITRSDKPVDADSEELLASIEALRGEIKRIELGSDSVLHSMQEELSALLSEKEELAHWGDYDRERLESLGLPVRFFRMAEKVYDPSWESECLLQETDMTNGKVWFVVIGDCPLSAAPLPAPSRSLSEVQETIRRKEAEIDEYRKKLEALKSDIPELKERLEGLVRKLGMYLAGAGAEKVADNSLLVFEGFAPTAGKETLEKALDELDCLWFSSNATIEDNPPIKLKNNKFVEQFTPLTDMYGRPGYNEFDPTPYISVFFLLFFAMCMGDAGYGLLLLAGGFIMRKTDGMKKFASLVSILGAGTFVVGVLMHTFFGSDMLLWGWIPSWLKSLMITGNIAGFESQMVLSIAIGIVHLCLAMVVKTVYATKNRGFLGSLGVWGWTVLIVGGVVALTLSLLNVLPAAAFKWMLIVIGSVSALGIFLFNDISRNPLKNIGPGLWETYNTVTGLLGDVLSYLRLYALGLAGGMLGKAFNDIAFMVRGDGSFLLLWIPCILILIVGHALNLAMCCLGAFVHPLRLNFLEFFKNSGYDGKGRPYKPLQK